MKSRQVFKAFGKVYAETLVSKPGRLGVVQSDNNNSYLIRVQIWCCIGGSIPFGMLA